MEVKLASKWCPVRQIYIEETSAFSLAGNGMASRSSTVGSTVCMPVDGTQTTEEVKSQL